MQVTPEEFKEAWEGGVEADHPPWDPPEIERVQPAPDWPPDVQQHYDRFQWVLFLLRKAHLQPSPAAPANALIAAGMWTPLTEHNFSARCAIDRQLASVILH